jgi:hypothetical protein
MARQSVESLLAWMKGTTRLSGWDGLVALSSDKINELLHQSYLLKLSEGVLKVPNGSVIVPESDLSHYFAGFALGSPVLNLEDASLQSFDIGLRLPVVSGVHTLLQTSLGVSRILKLDVYDPLSGPMLSMNLQPGTASPSVELDLRRGTDVLLQFAGTDIEQRAAGEYFQTWLSDQATKGQVYPVGAFDYRDNALLQVRRIDVRLQREDESRALRSDPKGAMLLFLTMEHGTAGGFPANPSDFRFLIPDDTDQPYSATAVFSQHLLHRAAFGHSAMQLLEAGEFEFSEESGVPSRQMVARAGSFEVPAGCVDGHAFIFESEAFSINASTGDQPLTVEFENAQASQHWQFPCEVRSRYRPVDDITWTHLTATFGVSLEHEFHLAADESAAHAMEGQLFMPVTQSQEVTAVSGLPPDLKPAEREQINGFIGHTIKRALLEAFSQTLTVTAVDPLLEQWALEGRRGFSTLRRALPLDLALFGRIHGVGSGFEIVQQQQVLGAGRPLSFSTEPVRDNLQWSLEPPPGSGGNPGDIDEKTGEYQAPPAHAMTGSVQQVLVIARDQATSEKSVALVTIVANPIAIHPLIQVCNYDEQVKLSASSLDEGALQWSIKNRVVGESGSVIVDEGPGGDHVYIAGPKVNSKTYVLDEVEVSAAGKTRSAWMLVLQQPPGLQVRVLADEELPQGQIRLGAYANGGPRDVEWSLPPGRTDSIDDTGIYRSDPSVRDRFVVIFARFNTDDVGVLEGHMILPLPLEDSSQVLQALAR